MSLDHTDIYGRTHAERGILDPTDSRATRVGFEVSAATEALAIVSARSTLPDSVSLSGLSVPLAKVHVARITGVKWWVTGIYGFLRSGGASADNPFAFADVYVSDYEQEWFSDPTEFTTETGYEGAYPSGPIRAPFDPLLRKRIAKPWMWRVTVWDIVIKVTLDMGIIGRLAGLNNTLNKTPFTIADKTFPAYTLWFRAPRQQSTLIAGTTGIHDVQYTFKYRADGWYQEIMTVDDSAADRELMFYDVAWTAASFPTS